VTRILLCLGTDVHHSDNHGFTALIWACIHHRVTCVELLLRAQAVLHKRCNEGLTPLMWACRSRFNLGNSNEIITILLAYKADISSCSNNGMDAFLWSCKTRLKDFCTNPQMCYSSNLGGGRHGGYYPLRPYYDPDILPERNKRF